MVRIVRPHEREGILRQFVLPAVDEVGERAFGHQKNFAVVVRMQCGAAVPMVPDVKIDVEVVVTEFPAGCVTFYHMHNYIVYHPARQAI